MMPVEDDDQALRSAVQEEGDLPELLTPSEVCGVLKISPAKFYRLVTSGRLPAVKIGSAWRVKSNALRGLIEGQLARGGSGVSGRGS